MVADNNVVFDELGDVTVSSCRNCPFLTDSMGEHCVLVPEIDMEPLYRVDDYLPKACPLRPGGLEVRLDFNRDVMLEDGKRFRQHPLLFVIAGVDVTPRINTTAQACVICGDESTTRHGLALWDDRFVGRDAAPWAAHDACLRCFDLRRQGVFKPSMTVDEARNLLEGE